MGLAPRIVVAFIVWNLVAWPLLPIYADALAGPVGAIWNACAPHGQTLRWTTLDAALRWRWLPIDVAGGIPVRMWTWNMVLFGTAVSALPGVTTRTRLRGLGLGAVLLVAWHAFDLLLTLESQLLSALRPDSYDVAAMQDAWFLAVKFLNNLNVLALRQVLPLLLAGAVWLYGRRAARLAGDPSGG